MSTMPPPILAIAGKNAIALAGARKLLATKQALNLSGPIFAICNANDSGEDTWQPSFKKFVLAQPDFKLVTLDKLYAQPNLYLFSLEFDKIIKVERFADAQLFNIHFSLLPAYKGMYTSALPLLHGATTSGVTLHQIDAGIDTGPIVAQQAFAIGPNDTARDLYFKYLAQAETLFDAQLTNLLTGNFTAVPQAAEGSTYFSKMAIDYRNLNFDLNKTAQEVHNQLRAFTFKEYQLPRIHGRTILGSQITATRSQAKAGTVIASNMASLTLATIDYDILLRTEESAA